MATTVEGLSGWRSACDVEIRMLKRRPAPQMAASVGTRCCVIACGKDGKSASIRRKLPIPQIAARDREAAATTFLALRTRRCGSIAGRPTICSGWGCRQVTHRACCQVLGVSDVALPRPDAAGSLSSPRAFRRKIPRRDQVSPSPVRRDRQDGEAAPPGARIRRPLALHQGTKTPSHSSSTTTRVSTSSISPPAKPATSSRSCRKPSASPSSRRSSAWPPRPGVPLPARSRSAAPSSRRRSARGLAEWLGAGRPLVRRRSCAARPARRRAPTSSARGLPEKDWARFSPGLLASSGPHGA